MADPSDAECLEFIQTAANRAVMPYVLPELQLLYWLEVHQGIDRHPRYVNLASRLRQTDPAAGSGGDVPIAGVVQLAPLPGDDPNELTASRMSITPLTEWKGDLTTWESETHGEDADEEEELLLEDLVAEPDETAAQIAVPQHAPTPSPERRRGPSPVVLEAQLEGVVDRDSIARIGLELSLCYARHAALFVVRGEAIAGLSGSTDELAAAVRSIEMPLSTPSLFTQPLLTRNAFRGAPPEDGIDGRLIQSLGRSDAQEVIVLPVQIRGRVVNLLYVDAGDEAFGETRVGALTATAQCLSRAYERAIIARKQETRADDAQG